MNTVRIDEERTNFYYEHIFVITQRDRGKDFDLFESNT